MLVVWLSVSPLCDSLPVPPSQLFSSGSLMRLVFFKTSAPMLETRVGVNREMMMEGPVLMTEALPTRRR